MNQLSFKTKPARSKYKIYRDLHSKYLKTLMEIRNIVWPHSRRASNVKVWLKSMNKATHTVTFSGNPKHPNDWSLP
jgi:hypothetical protein